MGCPNRCALGFAGFYSNWTLTFFVNICDHASLKRGYKFLRSKITFLIRQMVLILENKNNSWFIWNICVKRVPEHFVTFTKGARNGPILVPALLWWKDIHKFIFSFDTKTNLGCNQILSNWWPAFPYASQEPKLRTPRSKYYEKPYKKN